MSYTTPTQQGMVAPTTPPTAPTAQPMDMMNDPAFLEKLRSLPLEQQQAIIGQLTKDYAGRGTALEGDMTRAETLRNTPTPEGRTTRNGIYTAANPLEHIGAGLQRYKGKRDMEKARGGMEDLSRSKEAGLGGLMSGILRRFGGGGVNPLEYAP